MIPEFIAMDGSNEEIRVEADNSAQRNKHQFMRMHHERRVTRRYRTVGYAGFVGAKMWGVT